MKVLQNEKFLDFLSVSSISSLNILAVYMQVPFKVVPYKKERVSEVFLTRGNSANRSQFLHLVTS